MEPLQMFIATICLGALLILAISITIDDLRGRLNDTGDRAIVPALEPGSVAAGTADVAGEPDPGADECTDRNS